ncbi:MAG TPA: VWA domain-containing protein [Acidobacteriota bacterium]|nr:VWA domain-containing protein [Acidobacteriota bacterium]
MRSRISVFAIVVAMGAFAGGALSQGSGVGNKSFPIQPGDTLFITHDFGKVRIRPSEGTTLEIGIRRTLADPTRKGSPDVLVRKDGTAIRVTSSLSGALGESVDLEIAAPKFTNLTITGANPEVDVAGIQGMVRVQGSGGRVTVEDLASPSTISTDIADITYRASVQPHGDVRLESTSGNISCELSSGLSLHGWIRAGGKIFWDMDPMVEATSLEKQLGTGGPLLYAASLKGDVIVRLKPAVGSELTSSLPAPQVRPAGSSTVFVPARPRDAESQTQASPSSAPAPSAVPAREERRNATVANDATGAQSTSTSTQRTPSEPSSGNGQQPVVVQGGYALKVDVDSVFLNVSVREEATNRSIPGLRKEDFRVYEDGVQQQVDQFLPTEAPFNLLLLLDVSGSTASYLHLMKQAAIDFTKQINANDRVAIATFNSNVELVQGFTNDRAAAERAIQRIKSGGGTAFYDALMTCLDRYMRGIEGRSAIVVFTDGIDNQLEGRYSAGSRTTYDQLFRRVQESDTIIYTIFLDTEGQVPAMTRGGRPGGGGWPGGRRGGRFPGSPFPWPVPLPTPSPNPAPYPSPSPRQRGDQRAIYQEARDQLLQIADQTGGRMYSPRKIDELSGVYSQIADDLRIQYQLGYNSTNRAHDGKWREIRVEVENHPDAAVRTRKGYYARNSATQ